MVVSHRFLQEPRSFESYGWQSNELYECDLHVAPKDGALLEAAAKLKEYTEPGRGVHESDESLILEPFELRAGRAECGQKIP